MRKEASTQFGMEVRVKDRLDTFKAQHKNDILRAYKMNRRLVTNTAAVEFLLDEFDRKREKKR
jgi:hypothetical protein